MSIRELTDQELTDIPEPMQREVYDFLRFLKYQSSDDAFDGLKLSESVLAREWDSPEEDAAWANL